MLKLHDYDKQKSITHTEYRKNTNNGAPGVTYNPRTHDMFILKCAFDYRLKDEDLEFFVEQYNRNFSTTGALVDDFQLVPGTEVSMRLFPKDAFVKRNCFPVEECGKQYIFMMCAEEDGNVVIYKPDIGLLYNGKVGYCYAPIDIRMRVTAYSNQPKGLINKMVKKLLGDETDLSFTQVTFEYKNLDGYSDGDIYYEIHLGNDQLVTIPITRQALENKLVYINCPSYQIEFCNKKKVNLNRED